MDLQDNEKAYPIYSFEFKFNQSDFQGNSTGFSEMRHQEFPTPEDAHAHAMVWWNDYIKRPSRSDNIPLIDKGVELLSFSATYVEHETWCLTWFQHYTFNTHLTDEQLTRSFYRFVDRKERLIFAAGGKYADKVPYALMGADENWRWKGPCRCEQCVALGRVVIDH